MITSFNSFLTSQFQNTCSVNATIVVAVDNDFTTIANGFNCEITIVKRSTFNIENMKAVGKTVDTDRSLFLYNPCLLRINPNLAQKILVQPKYSCTKAAKYIYG